MSTVHGPRKTWLAAASLLTVWWRMMSLHTDPNWMLLFVNVDAKQTTGWYGYDLRVNRDISADGTTTSLDVWRGPVVGGYWECVGRVPIRPGICPWDSQCLSVTHSPLLGDIKIREDLGDHLAHGFS